MWNKLQSSSTRLSVSPHRPVGDLIDLIKSGSSRSFGSEKLRELCKLLPEEGEVQYRTCCPSAARFFLTCCEFRLFCWVQAKQLLGFKGDPSTLPEADLFMLMLVRIPRWDMETELCFISISATSDDLQSNCVCQLWRASQQLDAKGGIWPAHGWNPGFHSYFDLSWNR